MLKLLSRHWWVILLRGVLAVVFGLLALIWPQTTVRVLVVLFGIYAVVDGLFSLLSALASQPTRGAWWLLIVEAITGILVGVVAFVWPQVTAIVLLYLIAAWAIVTGILEVLAAIRLRREIEGEWALILAGLVSIALGLLLALRPASGLVAVVWFVGTYAILFGILLVMLALRLRGFRQRFA